MIFKGNVHKFMDNIDTDVIIPARFLNTSDVNELAKHCMEDIDKDFINKVKDGDIIVAENNFGCGSSREHAPLAIKGDKISIVIAKSFARIFYRNAINIGLPILICQRADEISNGDLISADLEKGEINNITKNEIYKCDKFPPFIENIINNGGLLNALKSDSFK